MDQVTPFQCPDCHYRGTDADKLLNQIQLYHESSKDTTAFQYMVGGITAKLTPTTNPSTMSHVASSLSSIISANAVEPYGSILN